MRNKLKNVFAGLMCMCLLCVSALQASAGQYMDMDDMLMETITAACQHANKVVDTWNEYTMVNEWQHNRTYYERYTCEDCSTYVHTYKWNKGNESHSLSYRDAGHSDMAHTYELNCTQCAYSTVTSIPCNNGGPHNTPW